MGYHLQGLDGPIRMVPSLLLDDQVCALRWDVADIGNWLPGKTIRQPLKIIQSVDRQISLIHISTDQTIDRAGPHFRPGSPVNGADAELVLALCGIGLVVS